MPETNLNRVERTATYKMEKSEFIEALVNVIFVAIFIILLTVLYFKTPYPIVKGIELGIIIGTSIQLAIATGCLIYMYQKYYPKKQKVKKTKPKKHRNPNAMNLVILTTFQYKNVHMTEFYDIIDS